jgi:hypothetical protein
MRYVGFFGAVALVCLAAHADQVSSKLLLQAQGTAGQLPPGCLGKFNPFEAFNDPNGLQKFAARCLSRGLPGGREPPETTILVEPQINTALRLAQIIFSFYQQQHPIGITRAWRWTSDGFIDRTHAQCLLLLSGTEPIVLPQATTLPEDMMAALDDSPDDEFHQAILRALKTAVAKNYCDPDARLIIAGHSLGGMEAQNIAGDLLRSRSGLGVSNIITFGSPLTTRLPGYISIRRFTTIGDPIPYTTYFTNTYREVTQTIVDDRTGNARLQAVAKADEERIIALGWTRNALEPFSGTVILAHWLAGAVGAHMNYPKTQELANFDVLGDPIGPRGGTRLVLGAPQPGGGTGTGLHMFGAPRHYGLGNPR